MKKISSQKLAMFGLLTAVAIVFGYVEFLIPLDFIAPGIKLGISNAVALFLICRGERVAAIVINITRVLLCAILFANAFSLLFSLIAGIVSALVMCLFSLNKRFGIIGISVGGAVFHNIAQLAVAYCTVGEGVLFYSPFLLIAGIITGTLLSIPVYIILKKLPEKSGMEEL